jgi:uncharacterized membrane protein YdcZ (DUF606 family)
MRLGAVGWAIVAALGRTVGRLGAAAALALVVGSQLSVALVIDLARDATLASWRSLVGVALVVGGATLLSATPTDH